MTVERTAKSAGKLARIFERTNAHRRIAGAEFLSQFDRNLERANAMQGKVHGESEIPWFATAVCIGGMILVVAFGTRPERQRTMEATVQMERLATVVAGARTIAPETARDIARLIRQSQYECMPMACDPALEARNHKARSRLNALIGTTNSAPLAHNEARRFNFSHIRRTP